MSESTLYEIDPNVVEPEWTELGLAKLISDGVLRERKRCEHKKIDGHIVDCAGNHPDALWSPAMGWIRWCPGAGIGDNEIQHEEWCNVFKNAGGCSCAGIGGDT